MSTSKPTTSAKSKRSGTAAASKTPKAARARTQTGTATSTKPVIASTAPAAASTNEKRVSAGEISKKELLERLVNDSGMKKGPARAALDATLKVLADAIRSGHDISAAPLGKIKITREKDTPNGKLAVLRVKLKDPVKTPSDTE